jgi:hypothetical protein
LRDSLTRTEKRRFARKQRANVPVVVDGVAIMPGHYVFADSSGAVVIPDGVTDFQGFRWAGEDSNHRPTDYEAERHRRQPVTTGDN